MSAHAQLFGLYIPGASLLHRLPVGAKYAMVLLGTLPSLLVRQWWLSAAVLGVAVLLLLVTRLPVRLSLGLSRGMLFLLGVITAYHLLTSHPLLALTAVANLLACLYLSRMLVLTTPAPVLVDALVAAARPLDRVGMSSERFGLAVALMLRSVPYLVGILGDVRTAAQARGLERRWHALVTPAVIGAVAYAQRTGEAMVARGLGDDEPH